MPEPGIDDHNFDRPTTGRNRGRVGKRLKLPLEYTEFRLGDGRYLGEVLAPSFFDAETNSPIPEGERQKIRDGNYPLAAMARKAPDRFAPRPEPVGGSTEDDDQGKAGEQPIPPKPDYSADYMDPVPRPLSATPTQTSRPAYLITGQAKFHDGEPNAFERVGGAAAMAVSELFEGPYGIAHENLGSMVNQSAEDRRTPVFGTIRGFNEILIEGGTQLGDIALRTAAAPFVGGIAAIVYRKLIGDWYYVVEEVQKKGQVLAVQSAYKTLAPKWKP